MLAIFWWEVRQRRLYTFWWCVILVATIALLMLIYPSIRDQAAQLNTILNQLPANLRSFRGFDGDIASPVGYLNSEVYYATLPLLLSIMTIGLGSSLLARDEQDHTLELLLARPVSRAKIILAKALAGLVIVLVASAAATLATLILAKVVGMDISAGRVALASLCCTALALAFGSIAFLLSATGRFARGASIAAATFVAFGGYILTSLANSSDWIKTPAKLFPYHYYSPDSILRGEVSLGLSVYLAAILVVALVASVVGFQWRDIE